MVTENMINTLYNAIYENEKKDWPKHTSLGDTDVYNNNNNNRPYWIYMLSLQLIFHMVHRLVIWLVSIYS